MKIAEEHWKTEDHGASAIDFVNLSGLAQRRLDYVAVIVIVFHVVAEHLGRHFDGQHVVNDQFAIAGQIVAQLVQLLNFGVLVLFLVVLLDEHIRLDELVERLLQSPVGFVHEWTKKRIVLQLFAERHQQVADGNVSLQYLFKQNQTKKDDYK